MVLIPLLVSTHKHTPGQTQSVFHTWGIFQKFGLVKELGNPKMRNTGFSVPEKEVTKTFGQCSW